MLLQLQIELSDSPNFGFKLFAILSHFALLLFHTGGKFLETVTLIFEVSVLLLQNRLVFIQESAEVVNFRVFQDLEALESS